MLGSGLATRARRIEIAARRLVEEQLTGAYHSVFKGRGLAFTDVRPYHPGDEARSIDWNITARMSAPHVKQFVEERERTIQLLVDVSGSGAFGSQRHAKREVVAELVAALALAASRNQDRVGLVLVSDRVERYLPPKKGRRQVLRLISELLAVAPRSRGTDLAAGLDFLGKVGRRRSALFVVSDFLATGWEPALTIAARRHEVVPVVVSDELEDVLPRVGVVLFEDLESGQRHELDTSSRAAQRFRAAARLERAARDATLRRLRLDAVEVGTDGRHLDALVAFFRARAKRARRG